MEETNEGEVIAINFNDQRLICLKNHFYIVVANLVVFTSLKAFVEIGFIIPYYVIRNEEGPSSPKYVRENI